MEGGEYKTQGADTCVYIPHVACARKGKTIRASERGTEFVSRITRDEYEVKVQKAVVKALDAIAVKGNGISQFFNLADSACAPKFKPEDKKENCTVPELQGNQGLINLVTPKQGDTLYRSIYAKSKPDALIKSSLKGLMLAMVQMNAEKVTHSDSHFNNLGWIGDQLVIFDWGRGTVGHESFKAWARRYLSWDKARQESWKRLSQHTIQFALLDVYPVKLTQLSSKGLFSTILSVWDTLGLLGPARAAGVVSEEKAKAFTDAIFESIRKKPNERLTEKLKVMIPELFGDPPAIHPIVAEKPMPPAEAKAVSRIIPAVVNNPESSVVEVKAAPAAPAAADPDKKKLEDMKDACRKLLAPGGGRRRTFRRKRHQKGGDYLDGGADTLVWEQKRTDQEEKAGLPKWLGLPIALMKTKDKKGSTIETLVVPPGIKALGDEDDHVVRMILLRAGEMEVHRALKMWAEEDAKKSVKDATESVKKYLNTFVGGNGVYETHPKVVVNDTTLPATTDTVIKAALEHKYFSTKPEKEAHVKGLVNTGRWYGLITRRQGKDIKRLQHKAAITVLITLMQPLLHVDGFWIHYDLHDGNMALMPDETPVIHDYGRIKFRDYDLIDLNATTPTFPSPGNQNILRNVLHEVAGDPSYYKLYRQYFYAADLMHSLKPDLNKRLLEASTVEIANRRGLERKRLADMVYMARTLAAHGQLYKEKSQVPMAAATFDVEIMPLLQGEDNDDQVRDYLNKFFKDPVYETRYHHIARIWDLLAVLRVIQLHAERPHEGKPPSDNFKDVALYSRGAAKKLIQLALADPPDATQARVRKIVDNFSLIATSFMVKEPDEGTEGTGTEGTPSSGTSGGGEVDEAIAAEMREAAKEEDVVKVEEKGDVGMEPKSLPKPDPTKFKEDGLKIEKADEEPATLLANAVEAAYKEKYKGDPPKYRLPEKKVEEAPQQQGGVLGGLGESAAMFQANDPKSWDFLPPAVDPVSADPVVKAISERYGPADIVAYISADPEIKKKQDIVGNTVYGEANALTYIALYNCDARKIVEAPNTLWARRANGRLERNIVHLPLGRSDARDLLYEIMHTHRSNSIPCLLVPKFDKTVYDAETSEGVAAMFHILEGLCIERDFVINDLHLGNMAIKGKRGMTFDFDRLIVKDEGFTKFKEQLKVIDRNSGYDGSLQYYPGSVLNYELDILTELKNIAEAQKEAVAKNTRLNIADAERRLRSHIENKARAEAAVEIGVGRIDLDKGEEMSDAVAAAALAKPLAALRYVEGELEKTTERFFRIYDQLAVLVSLSAICFAADKKDLAESVRKCESQLKINGEGGDERRAAIGELKKVFDKVEWPVGITIKAIMDKQPDPTAKRVKRGGRRTFRRKGLPLLL